MLQISSLVSPNSSLLHLNLPLQPQFHLHLQSQSSQPVGRKHHHQDPLLIGSLIHQSALIALPLALDLARCTTSQEVLWVEDKLLWGGMGVLLPQRLALRSRRLLPSAPQRAPPLSVVPHLWGVSPLTGGKETVVRVSLYCPLRSLWTARERS